MSNRYSKIEQNERTQRRVRKAYSQNLETEFFPEVVSPGYYDNDVYLRVAIYVRVSTDDPRQATSFELQKAYYEDFVRKHPKWELVEIYADDGISGTSLKHRDSFLRMIADCKDRKIDLIITKSVSRFARNVEDFMGTVHMLSDLRPPVGVFFETENLSSLNDDTSLGLSFQATMAEEESHNKSRSMETSLRMRLDHGLPLTPELLGFMHDSEGHLIINPETANIPKLMFFMYLYGYSTKQIADALMYLEKKTYLGNTKWTASGVARIMRNERYCGDVFTRKTFTQNYRKHNSIKNRGDRPRTLYKNEHDAIVSRDDFIAVQHMLNNAKYGGNSFLPELKVIPDGLLKGFVIINPRWSAFTGESYMAASSSVYDESADGYEPEDIEKKDTASGLGSYALAHSCLFDDLKMPLVRINSGSLSFNTAFVRELNTEYMELLVHPGRKLLAVRPCLKDNKNGVRGAKLSEGVITNKDIAGRAFMKALYRIFAWNDRCCYKMRGTHFNDGGQSAMIFNASEASVIIPADAVPPQTGEQGERTTPAVMSGQKAIGLPILPEKFGNRFCDELTHASLSAQTREDWKIRIEGEFVNTGMQLHVTDFDTLKEFITHELGDWHPED